MYFSHEYTKMPDDWDQSILLQVFSIDSVFLSKEFKNYDTEIKGGGNYNLPRGPLIVLLLQAEVSGEIWTTIRRCNISKLGWYKALTGSVVPMTLFKQKGSDTPNNTHQEGQSTL